MKTFIYGYGNADRQDDGVAWHVLKKLISQNCKIGISEIDIDFHDSEKNIDFLFQMQLLPEIADDLANYDRVCFIDAHTGAVPEDIHFEQIKVEFQNSPLTHHLTPSTLLAIVDTISHRVPETILVSIRGFEFGFSQSLSSNTALLIDQAVEIIQKWIDSDS